MSKMKPVKMWIDGKVFNIPTRTSKRSFKGTGSTDERAVYDIIDSENGTFSTEFKMPRSYCEKLERNATLQISRKTETKVEMVADKFSIKGNKLDGVTAAREELHELLNSIRKRFPAMQFLSFPTLSVEVKDNFMRFKELILNHEPKISGIDETIFQKPEKLHLTIMIFSLRDQTEIDHAVRVLDDCKRDLITPFIAKHGKLKIRLKGLACMEKTYEKANILYTKAKFEQETEELSLQNLADGVFEYFYLKGLAKQHGDVKIHVTLINTKYRRHSGKRSYKRIPFDASGVLKEFGEFDFGTVTFNSVHLSLMSAGEDGFYKPISVVNLENVF